MPLVAGVDSSTQSSKVVVVDVDSGETVATGRAGHDVSGTGGARESAPQQWWQALGRALAATGHAPDVAAIAVGAQQHGLVVLGDSRPLRPAMLWNDTRSAPQARDLTDELGGPEWWARQVGVVPVASLTATKWAWLRTNEPDIASAATTVCLPHDYLNLKLTGRAVTDRGDASGTGWFSTPNDRVVDEVLSSIRLDHGMLPEIHRDGHAGVVTSAAADTLGVPAGIPVGAGTGDNAAAALGLGVAHGEPIVSLGTSGTAFVVTTTPTADASGMVAGFADATDAFLPLAATLNCTQAVDRVAQWLGLGREAVADDTDVVVLPYMDGERTPNQPRARASMTGLTHDTTPEQILWATYLGAAWSLVVALERIAELTGDVRETAPVTVVGGGSRGRAWRRALAVLTGRPLRIAAVGELVALGAAAQAAAQLTGTSPYAVAAGWAEATFEHRPATAVDDAARERLATVSRSLRRFNTTGGPW